MSATSSTSSLLMSIHQLSSSSELRVSSLCLGGASFRLTSLSDSSTSSGPPAATTEDTRYMLDAFTAAGGNFIDTSNVYGGGDSERAIGAWLRSKGPTFRSQVVIATKYGRAIGDGEEDRGSSKAHIFKAVEGSLQRLHTHYIDLYQQHVWFDSTPIEETLEALNELVQLGKVRYVGCSNFSSYQLQRAVTFAKSHGLSPFISLQAQYSLLTRNVEWDLQPLCRDENVALIVYSPLAGGWLSGKFTRQGNELQDPNSRVGWARTLPAGSTSNQLALESEMTWNVVDVVRAIATELQTTPSAVAIRWALQRPGVSSVIIGPRTPTHLADNLQAMDIALNEEQMQRLTEVSKKEMPYPFNLITEMNNQS